MIKLAVLDIAGTTIEERNLVYDALRGCITEQNLPVDEAVLARHTGTEKHAAITALLADAGAEMTPELADRTYGRFTELLRTFYAATPPTPMNSVPEALEQLRGAGIGVVLTTGFSQEIATMVLEYAGWSVGPAGKGQVDAVICGQDVSETRPAPYMIFRAMEALGVHDVREVAVAGDTPADLRAGTHSGARIVAGVLSGASNRAALEEHPHTHILDSVAGLPELISQHR